MNNEQAGGSNAYRETGHGARADNPGDHRLYELNENIEATPEEFTKMLADLNNNRMSRAAKILELRFKMKAILTALEWKALAEGMLCPGAGSGMGPESSARGRLVQLRLLGSVV